MSRAKGTCRLAAAFCLVLISLASTVLADALITKAGNKLEGTVIDDGTFWLLIRPNGSKMKFPKSVIRQVTKKAGKSWPGKVVDDGKFWLLLSPDGRKTRFLKSPVRKVTVPDTLKAILRAEYNSAKDKAATPQAHWTLAEWCDALEVTDWRDEQQLAAIKAAAALEHQGVLERFQYQLKIQEGSSHVKQACANAIYQLRRPLADKVGPAREKVKALAQLASWCREHGLDAETGAVDLAAVKVAVASEDIGLLARLLTDLGSRQVSQEAEVACARGIYALRSKAVGDDVMACVGLAIWCREQGLAAEAGAAEAAALKIAPDSPVVREQLGYLKDSASGKWVKPWEVELLRAILKDAYVEQGKRGYFSHSPKRAKMRVALLDVEFVTHVGKAGRIGKRLRACRGELNERTMGYLCGEVAPTKRSKKLLTKPSQPFLSVLVQLILADGTRVLPDLTSSPEGADGWEAIAPESSRIWAGTDKDPDVLRYVRAKGLTVALVQPRRKVQLTLVYVVPEHTRKATLRFYNCLPVSVEF